MATLEDTLPPGHWDVLTQGFEQRCIDARPNGEQPPGGTTQCLTCSQHNQKADDSIAQIPTSQLWRTPAANGYAYYYVSSNEPLVLRHIPYQDRYTAHPAMIRGITLGEIRQDQQEIAIERKILDRQKRRDEQNLFLTTFDIKHFTRRTKPESHWTYNFNDFPRGRCLNLLIKPRDQFELVIPTPMTPLGGMIQQTIEQAERSGVDVTDRYIYLTVDQAHLQKGESLRTPGWHSDGFQGNEVSPKRPGDYQGIWAHPHGTEYADQDFTVEGLDPLVHNIFTHLSTQVREENIREMEEAVLHTHGPYLIHRSPHSSKNCYRRFVRITITHIPVTNRRMTLNPLVKYDYPIYTTDGRIPSHLT